MKKKQQPKQGLLANIIRPTATWHKASEAIGLPITNALARDLRSSCLQSKKSKPNGRSLGGRRQTGWAAADHAQSIFWLTGTQAGQRADWLTD